MVNMYDRTTHLRALAEVSMILDYTDINLVNKIPKKLLMYIRDNKDQNYDVQIRQDIPLQRQDLLEETKILMAIIYRNCFCNEEEKLEYDILLNQNQQRIDEEQRKEKESAQPYTMTFNPVFSQTNNTTQSNNTQFVSPKNSITIIEVKLENIFMRFINKIKKFFMK